MSWKRPRPHEGGGCSRRGWNVAFVARWQVSALLWLTVVAAVFWMLQVWQVPHAQCYFIMGLRCQTECCFGRSRGESRMLLWAMPTNRAAALQTLGLDPGATVDAKEIKRAFRKEVLKSHPDLEGGDAARFQDVKQAYEILTGRAIAEGPPRWTTRQGRNRRRTSGSDQREDVRTPQQDIDEELESVWSEIGYNPYTGKFYDDSGKPQDAAPYTAPRRRSPTASTSKNATGSSGAAVLFGALFVLSLILTAVSSKSRQEQVAVGVVRDAAVSQLEASAPPVVAAAPTPRVELVRGLEYALGVSVANAGKVPLLFGDVQPTTEALQSWFARRGQSLVGMNLDEQLVDRLWASAGRSERVRFLADVIKAALKEPLDDAGAGGALLRYKKIAAVIYAGNFADVQKAIVFGDDGLQTTEFGTVSGRRVVRINASTADQELLLVAALPDPQAYLLGAQRGSQTNAAMPDPANEVLPELSAFLRQERPDLVVIDLTRYGFTELNSELEEQLGDESGSGYRSGAEFLFPPMLQKLQLPVWTAGASP